MQKLRVETLGKRYSLISSPDLDKKPNKDEIFLFPSVVGTEDFEFDFCDTPPELCALIIGHFLLSFRGLPLDELTLVSRGKRYRVYKNRGYAEIGLEKKKINFSSVRLYGCECEFCDCGRIRMTFFKDADKVDRAVLTSLLLEGEKTDARSLVLISCDARGLRAECERELSYDELSAIAAFLHYKKMIFEETVLYFKDHSVLYTCRNGVLKMGVLPKIYK